MIASHEFIRLEREHDLLPIHRLLEKQAFDPEVVKVLVIAFDRSHDQLAPSDLSNPVVVELVAKLVIEFAKQGERDPARLNKLVSDALKR